MSAGAVTRVGFVSHSDQQGPHHDRLLQLVPFGVSVEVKPIGGGSRSQRAIDDVEGPVAAAKAIAERARWQAMACTGAPVQMEHPGYLERMRQAVPIPVTTAVEASGSALRALDCKRALLLTPFQRSMNQKIAIYLGTLGVEGVASERDFQKIEEAIRLNPDEVYTFAVSAFRQTPGVDAIYFQGAVLDPLPVLDKLESDLGIPVVASNPAMLWHTLALLGQHYSVPAAGRLLREWPALPA